MMARQNITDRAKRYRAQNAVTGPRKCVLCGSRSDLGVMHLTGNESHGEKANLAYGCRSCNGKLAAAFKRVGAGRPTNQYNPSSGVPTFEQYRWAVSNHTRKAHDAGGAVIHATPKHKRIEYARRMLGAALETKREHSKQRRADFEDRWNPGSEKWRVEGVVGHLGGEYLSRDKAVEAAKKIAVAIGADISVYSPSGAEMVISPARKGKRKREENPWPFSRPDARRTTPATGGIAHHMAKAGKRAPAAKSKAKSAAKSAGVFSIPDESTLQAGFKKGFSLADMLKANPAPSKKWARNIDIYDGESLEQARDYLRGAIATGKYIGLQMYGRKGKWHVTAEGVRKSNPAGAAAEVFEEFHGFAPSEVVTVTKQIHYHKHLAAAGKLTALDVWGVDEQGHHISGFKGALLAFNEGKNQLFVEGGDQHVNLEDFEIDSPHELETLGRVTDIGYAGNKTHLGDEGGEAVYVHKFRTTNKNGKHVVVKIARYPDLIYDVRNESLLFSGGSYEILREGINK